MKTIYSAFCILNSAFQIYLWFVNALKIYKSSAGSGKTYTLVKEYLRIVLTHPEDYKHILAITFTNKATEEMKSRIIDSLVDLGEGKNESLKKILQNELPEVKIRSQAKKALELILHDYSSFSVCTIDSFFQRVMRSLAREIHLPLRFELEMKRDEVIKSITEKLLNDVGKDPELADWLSDLIIQKLDDEKSWNIESDIHAVAGQLFREEFHAEPGLTREKIRTLLIKLNSLKKSFEANMKRFGDDAVTAIEKVGLEVADFSQKEKGVAGYFYKIRMKIESEKYCPNTYVNKAALAVDHWCSKTSPKKNKIEDLANRILHPHLLRCLEFVDLEFPKYSGAIAVLRKIYMLGIVNDLYTKLGEYREEKNIVLISDTPKILQSFISTDDAPFIFEKTGNRYKHFLIDEFQDTSNLQWLNLLPLITNSLASGHFSMVVGDAKQSIYRWRGGNMNLLAVELRKSLKHFDPIISEENLSTNFRSKRNIVEFNNGFFSQVPAVVNHELKTGDDTLLDLIYSNQLKQEVSEKNDEGGVVRVEFFEDDKREEMKKGGTEFKDEAGTGSEETVLLKWKQKSLNSLLEKINDLLKQHYTLSDMAILVRWNSEGNDIANFLFDHGIKKILSPDSLLLSRSGVIQFLIHVFRFLADNHNQVARSELMYFYAAHLAKEEIVDLHPVFSDVHATRSKKVKSPPSNALFEISSMDNTLFNKMLPGDFTGHLLYLRKLPVYELSEQLIRIFRLNSKPDAYIQRFQDLILEYSLKNNSSLTGFLQWWDENETVRSCSVTIPESEDAIRIMTIHKSKGLQFPVVLIPFADWKVKPDNRDVLWVTSTDEPFNELGLIPLSPSDKLLKTNFKAAYTREILNAVIDNVNLLYVAFTRAEEQLFISSPADTDGEMNTSGKLISRVIHQNMNWKLSENNSIVIGKSGHHQRKVSKKKGTSITMSHYPSNRWQGKLSISTHSADLLALMQSSGASKINYGILVHKILAEIHLVGEIEKTISKYYFEGLFSESEKKHLEEEIRLLFLLPEVQRFFSEGWTVMAEREIILPGGELLRPDRVLINGNQALVIDFKTGKESPSHKTQVTRYAEVLTAMDFTDVKKFLVYVTQKKVVTVE